MGSLEITMTIKCGECIVTRDHYSFKRNEIQDCLELAETINTKGYGYFTADQSQIDLISVKCKNCGHVDYIST